MDYALRHLKSTCRDCGRLVDGGGSLCPACAAGLVQKGRPAPLLAPAADFRRRALIAYQQDLIEEHTYREEITRWRRHDEIEELKALVEKHLPGARVEKYLDLDQPGGSVVLASIEGLYFYRDEGAGSGSTPLRYAAPCPRCARIVLLGIEIDDYSAVGKLLREEEVVEAAMGEHYASACSASAPE